MIADLFKDEIYLELYNVADDPQETNNLIFDRERYGGMVERMLHELRCHMKDTGDLLELPENLYETFLSVYAPFAH